ncbi:hypothetical protein [Leifsonia sp. EB34]|uniref:hypothetical protein n=1 Tax=Leifsonia sp. EB34 TaxID=3156303 RepID=UPI0035128617
MSVLGMAGCAGVTDAPAAKPSTATTPTLDPGSPNLSIRRDFVLSDGSTAPGCLTLTVKTDPSGTPETAGHLAAARAILADPRWKTEPVSLSELPAADLSRMKARGETEAVILAGLLKDHIQSAIQRAGVSEGIATSGFVGCR